MLALIPCLLAAMPAPPTYSFGLDPSPWMAASPGKAVAKVTKSTVLLQNGVLSSEWKVGPGISWSGFKNKLDRTAYAFERDFTLTFAPDWAMSSDHLKVKKVTALALKPDPRASRLSERLPGAAIEVELAPEDLDWTLTWRASLRDGSSYVRRELTFHAGKKDVNLEAIFLFDAPLDGAKKVGTVLGSPLVAGNLFVGFENPMSVSDAQVSRCSITRKQDLKAGQSVTYSSIIGVAPKGQMRRAFAYYVERERAHPYRAWLHYNSWYDIAFGGIFNETECLTRIGEVGDQLVKKRGVRLDGYLFDDGWDEWKSPWNFHKGFPNGFAPLKTEAAKYGAAPAVWLSPWGGYGTARESRLAWGKANGYEVDSQGYALSGPKYYPRFRQVCLDFVNKFGVSGFKFDGTGSPDKYTPGSAFDSDFAAAISLISDLRKAKPDLFINVTTGTWPSPFWLRYADSTWRGGADHDFAGVGTKRQQWITYRDGHTYRGVVRRGPLYPVNSLMIHGLLLATHGEGVSDDPGNDFADEIWTYFGCGTDLQEMYVTPSLLSQKNWDDIAEAAKWSRANSSVLVDTHWIGGDPLKLEVYGWASWSPKKSILVFRNPSDKPQTFPLDVGEALELPSGIKGPITFAAKYGSPGTPPFPFPVGKKIPILLKPFQVLVLEGNSK